MPIPGFYAEAAINFPAMSSGHSEFFSSATDENGIIPQAKQVCGRLWYICTHGVSGSCAIFDKYCDDYFP